MRNLPRIPITSVNVLCVTIVAAAVALTLSLAGSASAADPTFAIDAGIDGNSATSVGRIENCVEVSTGDRFQVDVIIEDVTDLLAWEIPIEYDPAIVMIVDQDVKLFQQANAGSSVLDLSAKLPDDSGFHPLAAFDSADPESPDSGSGVLARVTFEAVGEGASDIAFGRLDYDSDGEIERGSLIRDIDTNIVGDEDDDTFFDGEQTDAQVAVDGTCPAGTVVAEASTVVEPPTDDGSSTPWAIIGGGVAAAIVVLLAFAYLLTRRRGRSHSTGA